MPIYEYQCAACGQVTEAWQKFSEGPLTVCPACGGPLTKLISNSAFHLKGSGWYVSDYSSNRPNSATPDAGKETGEASAGKTSEAAADAAPAASSKIK
jgi:putative FmdB family regulatory protein